MVYECVDVDVGIKKQFKCVDNWNWNRYEETFGAEKEVNKANPIN